MKELTNQSCGPTLRDQIFVSYSHKDAQFLTQLLTHLKPLERAGRMSVWSDRQLKPGSQWLGQIRKALAAARVAVLLVSKDFLASDFVHENELGPILRDAAQGGVRILWIPVRASNYAKTDLQKYQAVIPPDKPLAEMKAERDRAWVHICDAILAAVDSPCPDAVPVAARAATDVTVPAVLRSEKRASPMLSVDRPGKSILLADMPYQFIRSGFFAMGSDTGHPHERPRHIVYLSSFFLASTTVTNADFAEFVRDTRYVTRAEIVGTGICLSSRHPIPVRGANWQRPAGPDSDIQGLEHHPVVHVSWFDAMAFCEWLSCTSGLKIVLPTEAQWEYAAAGPESLVWPFGNQYDPRHGCLEASGTEPVGSYRPNAFGLFDMAGNVYEWCADHFATSWTSAGHNLGQTPTRDPAGATSGTTRVLRGGSWLDGEDSSRCANRMAGDPEVGMTNWGFRCCLMVTDELLHRLSLEPKWVFSATEMLG